MCYYFILMSIAHSLCDSLCYGREGLTWPPASVTPLLTHRQDVSAPCIIIVVFIKAISFLQCLLTPGYYHNVYQLISITTQPFTWRQEGSITQV